MKKMIKKIIVPIVIVVASTLPACIGDNFEFDKLSTHVQLHSEWSFPIAYGTLTIQDMVDMLDSQAGDFISANDENAVVFRFQDTMLSKDASEVYTLKDQDFNMTIDANDYTAAGGFTAGTVVIQKNDTQYPFGVFENQLLDSILYHSSDLRIKINSNIEHGGQLIITFPELKKDGVEYVKAINIDPQGGTFTYNVLHNDLEGYSLDLTKANTANALFIQYTLMLNDNGSGTFNPSQAMNIDIELYNNQYQWLLGYVGEYGTTMGPSSINLEFLSSVTQGSFYLEAPEIKFIITNSFGLPTQYGFDYAIVHNERLGQDNVLTGIPYFDTEASILPIPEYSYPNSITSVTDTVRLFGLNSNISELIEDLPSYFEYALKFLLNPDPSNTNPNFMTRNSRLDVITTLDLPLSGRTEGLAFIDTTSFDFGQDSSIFDYVKNMQITLEIGNGFPHDIRIQGIITDMYGTPLDSLFSTLDQKFIVKSGNVQDGRINQESGKTNKTTIVEYNKERFNKWKTATHIIIFAQYNTTMPEQGAAQEIVTYYMDYGVDVKISARVEVEIDENL